VANPTLNRFFIIHFILPFIILLTVVHTELLIAISMNTEEDNISYDELKMLAQDRSRWCQ